MPEHFFFYNTVNNCIVIKYATATVNPSFTQISIIPPKVTKKFHRDFQRAETKLYNENAISYHIILLLYYVIRTGNRCLRVLIGL